MSQKVAIVIGHTSKDKGAYSKYLKISEWDFNNKVAEFLPKEWDVYYHNPNINGYRSRILETAYKINKIDYDLVLSLHFNAASPSANGAEALYYYKNKKGKGLANKFSELISKSFGLKNRGIKPLTNSNDRGFWMVYLPQPTTLILEPFFGTNKEDCEKISIKKYAEVIKKLVDEHFNS